MKNIKRALYALCLVPYALVCGFAADAAPNLTDSVQVERTAETAFAAKSDAMNYARRRAFNKVVARYSDRAAVEALSEGMTDAQVLNMVGSSSIANEMTSNTAYSALVTITFDRPAIERWLRENNVPNFISATDDTGPRAQVFFQITGGLREWAGLTKELREAGVWKELDVKLTSIWGQNVSATIAGGRRREFINAMRGAGWKVSEEDGIVKTSRQF